MVHLRPLETTWPPLFTSCSSTQRNPVVLLTTEGSSSPASSHSHLPLLIWSLHVLGHVPMALNFTRLQLSLTQTDKVNNGLWIVLPAFTSASLQPLPHAGARMGMKDITSLLQTFNEWSNFDLRIKLNKFPLAFPASLNITFSLIYSLQATPNIYPCLQHTKRLLGTCSHPYNRFSLSLMPSCITFICFSYLIFEILSSRSLPGLSILSPSLG